MPQRRKNIVFALVLAAVAVALYVGFYIEIMTR